MLRTRVRLITEVALGAALLAAPVAFAASHDVFIKLPDIKGEAAPHKDEIEILSYSWGATQAARVSKVDSFTIKQGTAAARGGVNVAAGDVNGDGRAMRPAPKGSLTASVKGVSNAEALCTPGRQLANLTLGDKGKTYELSGVTVLGCTPPPTGRAAPAETLSLNYEKMTAR